MRVAQTIVPTLAAGVAGWLATGAPLWSAAASVAALAALALLWFLVFLAHEPPKMARDAATAHQAAMAVRDKTVESLEAKAASYVNPTHDEGLSSAAAYVAGRAWQPSIWDLGDDEPLLLLGGAIRQVADKALNGDLHIWGRANPQSRHVKIPAEFWEHGNIMIETMLNDPNHPMITTTKYGAHTPPRYHDLRINRAEFEREWPL